jgi:hypothetical protein
LFELEPATFDEDELWKLAEAMKGDGEAKDGDDPEEGDFGAAYTYLGQFIDHDLTFDPSTFDQQSSDPHAIVNFRTPGFDLDNLYGRGPADQPYLFDGPQRRMLLGEKLFVVARNPNAFDLQRSVAASDGTKRAIIGDPRNDENVIVSQFQGMIQRFHNRIAAEFLAIDPDVPFVDIAIEVRRHYQWVVVHDFLTKIVSRSVLDAVSPAIVDAAKSFANHPPALKVYWFRDRRMPVEFSVAAYRLGHSMVRPGYRVNEITPPLKIFDHINPKGGLNAFGEFPRTWTIDWQRFLDLGIGPSVSTDDDRVQRAYKIDTSLVEPLAHLPTSVAGDEGSARPRLRSLAFRNLLRGQSLRLPSGQAIARAMGATVLRDAEIVIGPAEDGSTETETPQGAKLKTIVDISPTFAGNCPLWVYVLAEARRNFYGSDKRACLGAVGGRIVAETFLALLAGDPSSIVNTPSWRPRFASGLAFGLPELLRAALGL